MMTMMLMKNDDQPLDDAAIDDDSYYFLWTFSQFGTLRKVKTTMIAKEQR